MNKAVSPIPAGYRNVTPYLCVHDAAAAIEFYKLAFGATELMRGEHKGKVCHAELKMGDSVVMLADEQPEMGFLGPKALKGTPITLLLYIEDVDAIAAQATRAGATLIRPVEDKFYGDRSGILEDPFGHRWCISTRVEDLSDEETQARMDKMDTLE